MKKLVVFLTALFFVFTAFAHGPTPQKVQKSVKIAASPATVWTVVKDFDNANKWLPFVSDIKIETKGEEKFRTLTLKKGGKVLERLKGIDDDLMKIKFEIVEGDVPVADCNMYITVTKGANDNESEVQWTARFYRVYKLNPPIPEGQDDESALNAMNSVVDAALPELKKLIESQK
ncbi:SRPBCC family protein [Methylophilaceae bacterium]|jgi:mxaD protein|nr:SRPBCC family protein [Methylophilaceae bacterium]